MYLAYVDESGNKGAGLSYTLGCVFIEGKRWPAVFDDLIRFRRFLKKAYSVPVRAEVKANYLLRNGGPFRSLGLSEKARFSIYRGFMRFQQKIDVKVFAVVIRRHELIKRTPDADPRALAWEYLIQRLERFTTKLVEEVLVIHDEGDEKFVRSVVRRARRIGTAGSQFGTGSIKVPATRILEDPVPKRSDQSFFVQLADLVAYAAFRRVYPPPPRVVNIVPELMWDELGDARYAPVSAKGTPQGIVVWPPK